MHRGTPLNVAENGRAKIMWKRRDTDQPTRRCRAGQKAEEGRRDRCSNPMWWQYLEKGTWET